MATTQYRFDYTIDFLKDLIALPKEYIGIIDKSEEALSTNNEERVKFAFNVSNISELKANIPIIDEANIAKERDVEKRKVLELTKAIVEQNSKKVDILLAQNPKLNDYPDCLPLLFAISLENLDLVKKLVEKGADINTKNDDGIPILTYVINNKPKQRFISTILPYLVTEGKADMYRYTNEDINDIFLKSLSIYNFDIAKKLLELGYDINHIYPQYNNITALLGFISTNSYEEAVKFLLENGADMYKTNGKLDAMGVAIMNGNTELITLLKQKGYNLANKIPSEFGPIPPLIYVLYQIQRKTISPPTSENLQKIMKSLIQNGASMYSSYKGYFPMKLIIRDDKVELVNLFKELGYHMNHIYKKVGPNGTKIYIKEEDLLKKYIKDDLEKDLQKLGIKDSIEIEERKNKYLLLLGLNATTK